MQLQILKATIVAGCLDLFAACAQAYLVKGLLPHKVLQFIASGVFGKQAYSGDIKYILFGLFVHFLIVFISAEIFFAVYPKVKLLHKNIILNSFLIAIVAWAITTRLVIPLSRIPAAPFNLKNAIIAVFILFCCVGLPISMMAKQYLNTARS